MPFAQVHYPFENADWFEHHYPGDFIVEYNGQTRGWFYTLHVLATALFDRPAFRTCLAHGIVLGDDGQKMSKSRQQLPGRRRGVRPRRLGRDALVPDGAPDPARRRPGRHRGGHPRRRAAGACCRCGTRSTSSRCTRTRRTWMGASRTDSRDVLDRYILAKTHELVDGRRPRRWTATTSPGACATVRDLPRGADELVRPPVAASGSGPATRDAIDTLHTVLEVTCRVVAPLLPLTSEAIWRGLTGGRSVHLTDWPLVGRAAQRLRAGRRDGPGAAGRARRRCRCARRASCACGCRWRRCAVAAADAERLRPFVDLHPRRGQREGGRADDRPRGARARSRSRSTRAPPGRGWARTCRRVIKAVKAGEWTTSPSGAVVAAGIELREGEYERRLVSKDAGAAAELPGSSGIVVLDTAVTPELAREGLARDLVRVVQQARRDEGLDVSDRIALTLDAPEAVVDAVERARDVRGGRGAGERGDLRAGAGADARGHGLRRPRGAGARDADLTAVPARCGSSRRVAHSPGRVCASWQAMCRVSAERVQAQRPPRRPRAGRPPPRIVGSFRGHMSIVRNAVQSPASSSSSKWWIVRLSMSWSWRAQVSRPISTTRGVAARRVRIAWRKVLSKTSSPGRPGPISLSLPAVAHRPGARCRPASRRRPHASVAKHGSASPATTAAWAAGSGPRAGCARRPATVGPGRPRTRRSGRPRHIPCRAAGTASSGRLVTPSSSEGAPEVGPHGSGRDEPAGSWSPRRSGPGWRARRSRGRRRRPATPPGAGPVGRAPGGVGDGGSQPSLSRSARAGRGGRHVQQADQRWTRPRPVRCARGRQPLLQSGELPTARPESAARVATLSSPRRPAAATRGGRPRHRRVDRGGKRSRHPAPRRGERRPALRAPRVAPLVLPRRRLAGRGPRAVPSPARGPASGAGRAPAAYQAGPGSGSRRRLPSARPHRPTAGPTPPPPSRSPTQRFPTRRPGRAAKKVR